MRERMRGDVEADVPMARFTTLKVGGNADIVAYPSDMDDLNAVIRLAGESGVPWCTIGSGSNLLVRDGGIRGVVVNLSRGFKDMEVINGNRLYCGAGALLGAAVSYAARQGLGGIEFLSGIPGTVGGAVRMNAGAFGSEMKDVLKEVVFVDEKGNKVVRQRDELAFSYRNLEMDERETIIGCTFSLAEADAGEIRGKIKKFTLSRAEKQPLGRPTAGSVFKNPPGDYAGRLIEEAGLKGRVVGGAKVSERHANFIENMGGATAADIIGLMDMIIAKVHEKSGIILEPEVKIVGEDIYNVKERLN